MKCAVKSITVSFRTPGKDFDRLTHRLALGSQYLLRICAKIITRDGKYRMLLIVDGEFQGSLGLKYPLHKILGGSEL
jgi:hypothetical protein